MNLTPIIFWFVFMVSPLLSPDFNVPDADTIGFSWFSSSWLCSVSWDVPGSGSGTLVDWEPDSLTSLGPVCGYGDCFSCSASLFPWGFLLLHLPIVWDFSWVSLFSILLFVSYICFFLPFSTVFDFCWVRFLLLPFCICELSCSSSLLSFRRDFSFLWAVFSFTLFLPTFCSFWASFQSVPALFGPGYPVHYIYLHWPLSWPQSALTDHVLHSGLLLQPGLQFLLHLTLPAYFQINVKMPLETKNTLQI